MICPFFRIPSSLNVHTYGYIINIKRLYNENGNEILEILYYHYYFVVDKVYDRNNGEIDKKLLEKCLKEIIDSYIIDGYKYTNPSQYIHEKMYKYEKSYCLNKAKKYRTELINNAYNGDVAARYELFLSCISKIDDVAIIMYNSIINKFPNINYTLDDTRKVLYNDIWMLINRFYDKENNGYNLKTAISVRLRDLSIRINKYIENNNITALEMLKNNSNVKKLDDESPINRRI